MILRSPFAKAQGVLISSVLLGGAIASAAQAQDAARPTLKIVVPFAAGGGVDVVARIIVQKLGEELKQTVVIENRGGAGGTLAAAAVARSAPDGTTVLFGTGGTHGTNSSVYSKLSYDPVRDFIPVVLVSQSPLLLIAKKDLPANNFKEFAELAKLSPQPLIYASYGPGSVNHLNTELLASQIGFKTSHVPYRGAAPALVDVLGGRIDFMIDGVSTAIGYVDAGTIKLLAVAGARRTPLKPDVRTIGESGLPGYDASVWFGFFAPAGTPKAAVDQINTATNATLASPQVKEAFTKLGIEGVGGGPEELARRVKIELEKWPALVREKNISVNPG